MIRGVTLLELMVALALLALLLGVSGLAFRVLDPPAASLALRQLAATRDSAIATGQTRIWIGDSTTVRVEPDGSSSGGSVTIDGISYAIDPVTGAIRERR